MAISELGTSVGGSTDPTNATSKTLAHTLAAGSNRVVVIGFSGWNGSGSPGVTSVTYGGNACTQHAIHKMGAFYVCALYYIKEADLPADGSNDAVVTLDTTGQIGVTVVCLQDVEQATMWRASTIATAASATSISNNLTSLTSGDWGIDVIYKWNTEAASVGASQTDRANYDDAGTHSDIHCSTEEATGATVTMSWSVATQSQQWLQTGGALIPAAAEVSKTGTDTGGFDTATSLTETADPSDTGSWDEATSETATASPSDTGGWSDTTEIDHPTSDTGGFDDDTDITVDYEQDNEDGGWDEPSVIIGHPTSDTGGFDEAIEELLASLGPLDTGAWGESTSVQKGEDQDKTDTDTGGWDESVSITAAFSPSDTGGWKTETVALVAALLPSDTGGWSSGTNVNKGITFTGKVLANASIKRRMISTGDVIRRILGTGDLP